MMTVVCAWCKDELGYRQGPEGEVSHGICRPCQEKQEASIRRPFSVVIGAAAFFAWALLMGWIGECDRKDAAASVKLSKEIVASAPSWAVTRP